MEALVKGMDMLMRMASCYAWSRQHALAAAAKHALTEAVHAAESGVAYCCTVLTHSLPTLRKP